MTPVAGRMTFGSTKGHKRREVPIPRFMVDDLAAAVADKSPADLVFTGERGAVMRSQTFQRAALTEAAAELGIPGFHPHELRHTAASLAIASGADIKVVQQMLGHKSADDSRPVWPSFRRSPRRCLRCNGRGSRKSARNWAPGGHQTGTGESFRVGNTAMTRRNTGSPDGIRTRATALRGRRARPLHNGALAHDHRFDETAEAYQLPCLRANQEFLPRWGTRTRT